MRASRTFSEHQSMILLQCSLLRHLTGHPLTRSCIRCNHYPIASALGSVLRASQVRCSLLGLLRGQVVCPYDQAGISETMDYAQSPDRLLVDTTGSPKYF